ncbi:MAG: aldo/keto reductase [Desulfovermiculus sp.]|nr:aldo/keto reductase [Desulfovermiculus sp.]
MDTETPSALRKVPLGQTGLTVSELGFGGIPLIRLGNSEAERVVRHACDLGITLFDTANAYQDSEYKMGRSLAPVRDQVVLATKSFLRDGQGIIEHLENSLRQLNTDYVDLFQLHQISREEEWQEVTRPGGAMDALLQARDQSKIRWLGFSSHSLDMALRLIQTGHFATVQFPFNFIEQEGMQELLPVAREAGMGVLAMKPFAGGVIEDGPLAFSFLRQYPDAIPVPGFDSLKSVEEIVSLYAQPNQVSGAEQRRMEDYRKEVGQRFCRRCEYCQPCPGGVMVTTAMGYPLMASRMSPQTAVEFAREAMETVPLCEECGECEEKCPYDLPIMQMIQEHYQLFKEHKGQ